MKYKWTIGTAEDAIRERGGDVKNEKIFMPPDWGGTGFDPEWEDFWAAKTWLQTHEDYDCDLNDPIAYVDIDEFLMGYNPKL